MMMQELKLERLFKTESGTDTFLKKLLMNRGGMTGLIILSALAVIALFSSFIAPYSPYAIVAKPYLPSSAAHLFGTDGLGRDIFSQMIYGTRLSLEIGFVSAVGITSIGTLVGIVSGYIGSFVDEVLMRFVDVMLVIPSIAFMIFVSTIMGPGVITVLTVIIVFGWPPMSRMIRSQVLSLKKRGFVESAIVSNTTKTFILFRMILPNIISLILANALLAVIYAIIADASLAFIGLASTTSYSWGTVLYNAQIEGAIYHNGILWITLPGLAIALTGVSMTLLARAFGDITDPRYSTEGR
ncbi:MAG: ABC transporter permease [Thermoplasmata archaeon]|nr:ABC transporter permease [Candidatus Sysuiplasma acidicola]